MGGGRHPLPSGLRLRCLTALCHLCFAAQRAAQHGAEVLSVRLSMLKGEPQAQLDGFRSRVVRALTVCSAIFYIKPQEDIEVASTLVSVATNSGDRQPPSPLDAQLINVYHDSSAHTLVIELSDTSHFNALGGAMATALANAIRFCGAQPEAAFVLQGAGPHFCIGGNPFEKQKAIPLAALAGGVLATAQICCSLRQLAGPVVSAVHGHLVGGGVALALNAGCMCADRHAHWLSVCPLGLSCSS